MDSGAGKCIMPIVPSYDLDSSILNYIDISKKINKSWESFGWHVRASMDAHFPIALRLYTLLQGAQATGNLKKKTSNNSPGKNAETSMEIPSGELT